MAQFTSREAGESYITYHSQQNTMIGTRVLGQSVRGRDIRAVEIGDITKPAIVILAAQHGDEPAGREASLQILRSVLFSNPLFFEKACLVLVPTVNIDQILIGRLSANRFDLNSNWGSRSTPEISSVSRVLSLYDTKLVIDCHEGGGVTRCLMLYPTSPGIDSKIVELSKSLYNFVGGKLEKEGEPWGRFPGSENTAIARNSIPLNDKIPTLLIETPSMLSQNMYYPSATWRVHMYKIVIVGAMEHFLKNLRVYSQRFDESS